MGTLGTDVTIKIEGLANLDVSKLKPLIDEHPIKDQLIPTDTNGLTFRIGTKLGRSRPDLEQIEYLHQLAWGRTYATKSYFLSLSIEDPNIQSNRVRFMFTYLSPTIFWLVFIGLAALLSIFVLFTRKYNPIVGHDGKLSLAMFQMTIWTWLIISGCLYLVLLKGEIKAEKRISDLEPLIENIQDQLDNGKTSSA